MTRLRWSYSESRHALELWLDTPRGSVHLVSRLGPDGEWLPWAPAVTSGPWRCEGPLTEDTTLAKRRALRALRMARKLGVL